MSMVRLDDETKEPASEANPEGWLHVKISQIGGGQELDLDFASWESFRNYVEKSDPAFGFAVSVSDVKASAIPTLTAL